MRRQAGETVERYAGRRNWYCNICCTTQRNNARYSCNFQPPRILDQSAFDGQPLTKRKTAALNIFLSILRNWHSGTVYGQQQKINLYRNAMSVEHGAKHFPALYVHRNRAGEDVVQTHWVPSSFDHWCREQINSNRRAETAQLRTEYHIHNILI